MVQGKMADVTRSPRGQAVSCRGYSITAWPAARLKYIYQRPACCGTGSALSELQGRDEGMTMFFLATYQICNEQGGLLTEMELTQAK